MNDHDDPWHPRRVIGPAALAATLLLLSFHQVVAGAVRHAQEARAAVEVRHEATAPCSDVADEASRNLCRSRLAAPLVADAGDTLH